MKLRNATPHVLRVFDENDRVVVEVPRSERPARVSTTDVVVGQVPTDGGAVPLVESRLGSVHDLPDPAPDQLVVVSQLVADMVDRDDLVVPHQLVRDDSGAVVGCRALRRTVGKFDDDGDDLDGLEVQVVPHATWSAIVEGR